MITELFPDAKNVGIIYCSGEPNSVYQADVVKGDNFYEILRKKIIER